MNTQLVFYPLTVDHCRSSLIQADWLARPLRSRPPKNFLLPALLPSLPRWFLRFQFWCYSPQISAFFWPFCGFCVLKSSKEETHWKAGTCPFCMYSIWRIMSFVPLGSKTNSFTQNHLAGKILIYRSFSALNHERSKDINWPNDVVTHLTLS